MGYYRMQKWPRAELTSRKKHGIEEKIKKSYIGPPNVCMTATAAGFAFSFLAVFV